MKLPTASQRLRVVLDWTVDPVFERDLSELAIEERWEQGATA